MVSHLQSFHYETGEKTARGHAQLWNAWSALNDFDCVRRFHWANCHEDKRVITIRPALMFDWYDDNDADDDV